MKHHEPHRLQHSGWLRAAVLGANDGIISTASLLMGMAAAEASASTLMTTGMAGMVAGALSMAAGEYISVSSQADIEQGDLAREAQELLNDPDSELRELTGIYMSRGLDASLAKQVAEAMTTHDSLAAHARDELGLHDMHAAKPIQAAMASAGAFAMGACLPLLTVACSNHAKVQTWLTLTTLFSLCLLGALAARTGGASMVRGALRVALWGAIAMLATAAIGHAFGVNMPQ